MKKPFKEVDIELDKIAKAVVDAAFKVHFNIGPGLLESAYEACLAYEISQRGLSVEQQVAVPLVYEKVNLNVGFRIDLIVQKRLIVEVKAVETLLSVHRAQILSYLKLSGLQLGLLINFNGELGAMHVCPRRGRTVAVKLRLVLGFYYCFSISSTFAAQMKSLVLIPLMAWVWYFTLQAL